MASLAVGTFSREIYPAVLQRYPHEQIAEFKPANCIRPIWLVTVGERRFVFYLTEIGSALASTDIIEINWLTGAERFVLFGSAGSLDPSLTQGNFVIPTEAVRDEGMSYHYAPPADTVRIANADYVERVLSGHGVKCAKGKVWTTDAFYRETRRLVQRRKDEGCIAVEMELAGVQTVCDFYGWQLYDFLVTGDLVNQPIYSPDGLKEANHDMQMFDAALLLVESLLPAGD